MAQKTQQEQIVTQSNLKLVLAHAQSCNKCITLTELIQITTVMDDYVKNGYSKEIKERFDKINEVVYNKKQQVEVQISEATGEQLGSPFVFVP